jgi:hypothetical protein
MKLDVSYPREYTINGEKKTHWIKCGVAFSKESHTDVILYVVPPSTTQSDGSEGVRFQLREPRAFEDAGPQRSRPIVEQKRQPAAFGQTGAGDDEKLPF